MHAHLAVVLPAALVLHFVFLIFAGNAVVVATPVVCVNGVDVATGGVGPFGSALGAEGICGKAVVDGNLGVVIRIACHVLALAIDEELVDA